LPDVTLCHGDSVTEHISSRMSRSMRFKHDLHRARLTYRHAGRGLAAERNFDVIHFHIDYFAFSAFATSGLVI